MTMRCSRFAMAAICFVVAHAAAQLPAGGPGYSLKKCDDLKMPIGMLPKGVGTVSYLLSKDGKPDTASIVVLNVVGLSVAGFKSVTARELSACRLDTGKPEPTTTVSVVSDIAFGDSTVQIGVTTPSSTPGTPLALEPQGIPKDSFPLTITDRRVEERPRRLSCKAPAGPPPIRVSTSPTGGGGATQTQAQAQARAQAQAQVQTAQDQWNAAHGGTLVAEVLIGIDGKPGTQIRVISVSNPMAAQNLAEQIGGCRFAAGRVHGITVPALVQTKVP